MIYSVASFRYTAKWFRYIYICISFFPLLFSILKYKYMDWFNFLLLIDKPFILAHLETIYFPSVEVTGFSFVTVSGARIPCVLLCDLFSEYWPQWTRVMEERWNERVKWQSSNPKHSITDVMKYNETAFLGSKSAFNCR